MGYPDNNPKTGAARNKLPLHLIPPPAKAGLAEALADGARKYGPYNWREKAVSSTVYIAACQRHLDAWFDGEAVAPDSGINHLHHAMACLAILVDAMNVPGCLVDDRPPPGASQKMQEEYATREHYAAISQPVSDITLYVSPALDLLRSQEAT